MKLTYKAYALDDYHYMRDDEVRIYPSGRIEFNNGTAEHPFWEELADTAEWLLIESATLKEMKTHEASE